MAFSCHCSQLPSRYPFFSLSADCGLSSLLGSCAPSSSGPSAPSSGSSFGFQNFGRLLGVNRLASAIITTLQYPLIQ